MSAKPKHSTQSIDDLFKFGGGEELVDDANQAAKAADPAPTTEQEQAAVTAEKEVLAGPNGTSDAQSIFDTLEIPPGNSHSQATAYDIETGPDYDSGIEFDESSVKLGRMKDPEKIAAKMAEERAKFDRNRALSPLTGKILAIGYIQGGGRRPAIDTGQNGHDAGTEAAILENFWRHFQFLEEQRSYLIGFNCEGFDLPFIVRRSWKCRIEVPQSALGHFGPKNPIHIDLMRRFTLGKYGEYVGLNDVAKFLCAGAKPPEDECSGAIFAELFTSGDEEKIERAIAYLLNDLDMTWGVAARLGVVV